MNAVYGYRSQVTSHVTSGDFCYLRWTSSLQCPLFHHVAIRRTEMLKDEELVSPNVDKVMMWIQDPARVSEYLSH